MIKIKKYFLILSITSFIINISAINFKPVFDLKKILIKADNRIKHALFSPRDNVKKYLIELIKNEKKGIKAALYIFSDKNIMQELINAKKERNVTVEIILDRSNVEDRLEKMLLMQQNSLDLFIFNAPKTYKNYAPIMHHKFFIFKQNICKRPILWTGSFNCTPSANFLNCENVTIVDDDLLLELYEEEFEKTKKNCRMLQNNLQKKVESFKLKSPNQVRDFRISKL